MIADLHPCSFIDFPGELTAVVFTQGCNLRCRYCHNPTLCPQKGSRRLRFEKISDFLASRKNKLTAVTVTGGEPTLHAALPTLLDLIRAHGFKVKLDTNGMTPHVVRELVSAGQIDYAAVDVKVARGFDGSWLTGARNQGDRAMETLQIFTAAHIQCEARTTAVGAVHTWAHLKHIAQNLVDVGVQTWRLQPVLSKRVLDATACLEAPDDTTLASAVAYAATRGLNAAIRPSAQKILRHNYS